MIGGKKSDVTGRDGKSIITIFIETDEIVADRIFLYEVHQSCFGMVNASFTLLLQFMFIMCIYNGLYIFLPALLALILF